MAFVIKNTKQTTKSPVLDQFIKVEKASATVPQTAAQSIFTVRYGRVLVKALIGEVTTTVGAGTTPDLQVEIDPSGSGTTVDIATDVVITSDEVGTLYSVEGDGTALVAVSSGYAPVPFGSGFIVNPGTLQIRTSESTAGATKWTIWYVPLDGGANVISA